MKIVFYVSQISYFQIIVVLMTVIESCVDISINLSSTFPTYLSSYLDNNNNIFAIVQSTVSDLLKDSNPLGLE